jgi:hypothetical protein
MMVEQKKAPRKKLQHALLRGMQLTKNLKAKDRWWDEAARIKNIGKITWRKWYLLYNGKKYYSRFKNSREAERYYSR